MRPFRPTPRLGLTLLLLGSLAGPSPAADTEEIRSRLRTAREKFAEMQDLKVVYFAKKELADEVSQRVNYRREVEATVRMLKIEIDGYPARRTNLQQAVYNNWLGARAELTEVDRQIGLLRSRMREIDEELLSLAAATGKRPGPGNRRDILVVYPEAERRCREAFEALKVAVSGTTGAPEEANRLLREANAELNRSGEGDARIGPSAPFFAAFADYTRPAPVKRKANSPRRR